MAALVALARGSIARLTGGGGARRLAVAGAGGAGGSAVFSRFFGGDDRPRKRRRKRVFTASDRADISFITATLGSPSGKAVAMIIAARA